MVSSWACYWWHCLSWFDTDCWHNLVVAKLS
uniref:GSVIVT01015322001, LTM1 n=1 Tax=Arundo donax TaxID=35708 RepID=A0A0A9FGV8_ARUDO